MIDHDPLCPYTGTMHSVACECGTIGRARADERERIAQAIEAERELRRPHPAWWSPAVESALGEAVLIARDGGWR